MGSLIFPSIVFGAFILALFSIFGIWAVYRYATTRSDSYFASVIFWLIGSSAVLVEVLASRATTTTTNIIEGGGGLESTPTFLSTTFGRLSVLLIVSLAGIRFIIGSFNPHKQFVSGLEGKKDPAKNLFYSYLFYFTCCGLINSLAGTAPAFVHWMFYPVAIIGAIYLSRNAEAPILINNSKTILLLLIYSSLLAAIFFPSFAYETSYRGLIPGLTIRLYGLTAHPNTLGPVALLFLVLEYYQPTRNKFRRINTIAAVCVFVLAQSKTAYGAAAIVLLTAYWFRPSQSILVGIRNNRAIKAIALVTLTISSIGLTALIFDLLDIKFALNIFSYLDAQDIKYLSTLTGRTMIWDITLDEWRKNWAFGYGPTIWYPEFRAKYGLLVVGQAHNQYIQALGEAGLVGLFGLLIYILMLIKSAISTARFSNGLSLALIIIPLSRTWTETPFRNFVINDWAFFTHLLVLSILICLVRQKSKLSRRLDLA